MYVVFAFIFHVCMNMFIDDVGESARVKGLSSVAAFLHTYAHFFLYTWFLLSYGLYNMPPVQSTAVNECRKGSTQSYYFYRKPKGILSVWGQLNFYAWVRD